MTEFEDRFSQINISSKSPRRKKLYHYPTTTNTTPSTPTTTVAKPHTPNRIISNTTVKSQHNEHSRIISYPISEQQFEFSFMKETWSSQQKKNNSNPFTNLSNNLPKKRIERKSSQSSRNRRLVSSMPKLLTESPSVKHHRSESSGRSSSKSDVFTRLYTPKKQEHEARTRIHMPSPKPKTKIASISELYRIIYHKNSNLFQPNNPVQSNPPLSQDNIPLHTLNIYERGEIIRKREIYYIPKTPRTINIKNTANFGFDDSVGHYNIYPHDHINYRFEIQHVLGKGSFGNVIQAIDHKTNQVVAIKIINNNLNWSLQAVNEIKLLKFVNEKDKCDYILSYITHFNFRSHLCIVSELLSLNLYTLLEMTEFQGLTVDVVKLFTRQILSGVAYLHNYNIIHCDLKPENIMIKLPSSLNSQEITIKLIDFGSACFTNEISFTYIQSRFYRAPEILLGGKYNEKIDIWSIGCIICELFTGIPLFPGKSEIEQIGLILEILGSPKCGTILRMRRLIISPQHKYLEISNEKRKTKKLLLYKIFDNNGKCNLQNLNNLYYGNGGKRQFKLNSKSLDCLFVGGEFSNFLNKMFIWDPIERANASELLQDSFLK